MGTNFYLRNPKRAEQAKKDALDIINDSKSIFSKYINKEDYIDAINNNWFWSVQEQLHDVIDNLFNKDVRGIHIGKRSGGWQFLWDSHQFHYYKPSKEALIEWLKSGEIIDEYGEVFTFDQFWNDEIGYCLYHDPDKCINSEDYNKLERSTYNWSISYNEKEPYIKLGLNPSSHGEFYVDDLRFATYENFS